MFIIFGVENIFIFTNFKFRWKILCVDSLAKLIIFINLLAYLKSAIQLDFIHVKRQLFVIQCSMPEYSKINWIFCFF